MKPVTVLRRALKYIRKGWTRGAFARDREGNVCDETSRRAVCWCAVGAIQRASPNDWYLARDTVALVEGVLKGSQALSNYNDAPRRTKAQVIAAFEKAIERVKAQRG